MGMKMRKSIKSVTFKIGKRLIAVLPILLLSTGNPAVAKTVDEIDQVGKNAGLLKALKVTLVATSYNVCEKGLEKTKQPEPVNETAAYRNFTIIFIVLSLYRIWRLTYGYRGD